MHYRVRLKNTGLFNASGSLCILLICFTKFSGQIWKMANFVVKKSSNAFQFNRFSTIITEICIFLGEVNR